MTCAKTETQPSFDSNLSTLWYPLHPSNLDESGQNTAVRAALMQSARLSVSSPSREGITSGTSERA